MKKGLVGAELHLKGWNTLTVAQQEETAYKVFAWAAMMFENRDALSDNFRATHTFVRKTSDAVEILHKRYGKSRRVPKA